MLPRFTLLEINWFLGKIVYQHNLVFCFTTNK